ncbi:MAG: hypothetical protein WD794_03335 [Mycobacteriales bacterium]
METSAAALLPARPSAADVPGLVRHTFALLRDGVPLTLLMDLADEAGPHSAERYTSEGGDARWLLRTPAQLQ